MKEGRSPPDPSPGVGEKLTLSEQTPSPKSMKGNHKVHPTNNILTTGTKPLLIKDQQK